MPRPEDCHEIKEHGGREFPYNIYPCSIPEDFEQVPFHWHEEMELVVIKKGRGAVTVDTHVCSLKEGEAVAVFPGQLHSIWTREGESMEYENIIFRLTMLMSGMEDLCTGDFLLPFLKEGVSQAVCIHKDMPIYEDFMNCVKDMDQLCGEKPYGYQLGIKSALFRMLYLLLPLCSKEGRRSCRAREKIKTVLGYMEDHFGEKITIQQAADLCYYSKSHFMKFFKEYMGVSFVEYLNRYRLAAAARKLATEGASITETAQSCGFDNISYFNRLFKERYGQAPGQYRNMREKNAKKE